MRGYGVEVLAGRAVATERTDDDRFRVQLSGGSSLVARRVVIATGIVDELPSIVGLAEHWGGDVIHCPFCHGYEVRDRNIVQVVTHPMGLHPTTLLRQLTERLTVVVDPSAGLDDAALEPFTAGGIEVRVDSARALVTDTDTRRLTGVELACGTRLDADVVVVGPRFRPRLDAFAGLGIEPIPHPSGLGDSLTADETGQTDVAGVYAAGNVKDPSQQVLHAAADGSRVGAMVSFDLAAEDLRLATRPAPAEHDWERRYAGEQVWSGNPNGTLVDLVSPLTPGRALDVGAGEGGDSIWLAERSWSVTATDISTNALARIREAAAERGLAVECRRIDAGAIDAFGGDRFDLVSMFYGAIHRSTDRRAEHALAEAVAPGGTLLVVGHDPGPMRAPIDTAVHSRAFDPDAYVGVDSVAEVLADDPGWEVLLHETRPRPAGSASAAHHVDDVVLLARRRS